MAEAVWPQSLIDLMLEMPERDREQILSRVRRLESGEVYLRTIWPSRIP